MCSPTSPSSPPACSTRFPARSCGAPPGTSTPSATGRFASWRTKPAAAGCSPPTRTSRPRSADGPLPPGVPGYAPVRPIPANPDSARRLLGGRHIAFELLTVGSGEGALEQMIQARLAAVGFDVAIRQLELTAFLARVNSRQRDFTAAVLGTPGDPGLGYLQTLAELAGVTPVT